MRMHASLKIGITGLVVGGSLIAAGGIAYADYAPQAGDVVGVGGDTAQYAAGFLADGDYLGDAGFNAVGAFNRDVAISATADANGRQAYLNGSTLSSPSLLNPTVVLRAGEYPVQRVSSSGAALTALLGDTSENINYIWSSSLPTAAQQNAASTSGWGGLHVVEIGTDTVEIAVDKASTNAPSGLSINELLYIYTHNNTEWSQVPGITDSSNDVIIPELPPSSSSIYKTFLADLKTANGNVTPPIASYVKQVEQNDPTSITTASTPADAIVPFSQARLNLWNDGYFHNPATAEGAGTPAVLSPGVVLLNGTPSDSNPLYSSPIKDYVIFRQNDLSSSTPFEPGGTLNWAETLFSDPTNASVTPFVESAAGQALIAASGVTPNYQDLGLASSG